MNYVKSISSVIAIFLLILCLEIKIYVMIDIYEEINRQLPTQKYEAIALIALIDAFSIIIQIIAVGIILELLRKANKKLSEESVND